MTDILDFWPFPYEPRENQITALRWLEQQDAKFLLLEAPVGCHQKGTPILMYSGELRPVEDLKQGDLLMGPDSTPRKILSLHRGREQMYTITPNKGESFVVNENHILSLTTTPARRSGFDGKTTINISVKSYIQTSNDFKRNTKLYRPTYINFKETNAPLPIDPYFLGVLLGDGTICNGHVGVTTQDEEIKEEIYFQANKHKLAVNIQECKSAPTYYISTGQGGGDILTRPKNPVLEHLCSLNLIDTRSHDKFIPFAYKIAPKQDRLQLLAGLIDSDGSYTNVFNITSKSERLINDIIFLARSLGFNTSKISRFVSDNEYYTVVISGSLEQIPTRLRRKKATSRRQKKRVNVTSFKVSPANIDDYYGFSVDKDNLYVMGNFIVTHNSGKSNTGITYSHFLGQRSTSHRGDSFILTPQRILQAQYEDSFKDIEKINLASLYGKTNYPCQTRNTSCEVGSIVKPRCSSCPFQRAKSRAKSAADTVLNYKLALTSFAYTNTFDKRKLIIFDECHTLENHLVDFDSVQVAEWRCKKYNLKFKSHKNLDGAVNWLTDYYIPALKPVLDTMESQCEEIYDKGGDEITQADVKKIRELNGLWEHYDQLVEITLHTPSYINDKYVLVWDKVMFQFKRITGEYSFHKHVEPKADRFLFMSSTILNKQGFCEDLGLREEDTAFLTLDSNFPKENRPVYFMPQMRMNSSWNTAEQAGDRKTMLDAVEKLLSMHEKESGLIHTANFQISDWLVQQLSGKIKHKIYHHNPESGDDRNAVIAAFLGDPKPSVLISPSCTEGLDLKDDLGRFAIFVKTPFPYLGDQWIKRRMEMSPQWYMRRALTEIIQGGGRVVRSDTDKGNVYILDASFSYLHSQSYYMIPKWWKDAYIKV
jgi:intein/homing endonuclease